MTTRLNKQIRKDIVAAAMKRAFGKESDKLLAREHALAEKCTAYAFGGPAKYKKVCEFVKQNPQLSYRKYAYGNLKFGKVRAYLSRDPATNLLPRADSIDIPSGHKLTKEYEKLNQDKETLAKKRQELTDTVNEMLGSVFTIKQLLVRWPECEEILPEIHKKKNMESANKVLGIGSKKT